MMKNGMEEQFDHSLESFFNQLINPFSEQENHMIHHMYMYNNGTAPPPGMPPPNVMNRDDTRLPPSTAIMGDLNKLKVPQQPVKVAQKVNELKDSTEQLRPLKEGNITRTCSSLMSYREQPR